MSTPEDIRAQFNTFRAGFVAPLGKNNQGPQIPNVTPPQLNNFPQNSVGAGFQGAGVPGMPAFSTVKPVFPISSGENKEEDPNVEGRKQFQTARPLFSSSASALTSLMSTIGQKVSNAPYLPTINLPTQIPRSQVSNTSESAELPEEEIGDFSVSKIAALNKSASIETTRVKTSIADALLSAKEGSLIIVPAGTYSESLNINKRVHIKAEGEVILVSDVQGDTITIKAGGVTIDGIDIQQNDSQAAGAINVVTGSALFENCKFSSNYMPTIAIKGSSVVSFKNCEIKAVDATAVSMSQSVQARFENTSIKAEQASACILKETSRAKFTFCKITSKSKTGIVAADNSEFLIDNSVIYDCGASGIEISTSGQFAAVTNSKITNCNKVGIGAYIVSTPHVKGCTLEDCGTFLQVCDGAALRSTDNKFANNKLRNDISIQTMMYIFGHSKIISNGDSFTGIGHTIVCCDQVNALISHANISNITGYGVIAAEEKCVVVIDNSVISHASECGVIALRQASINLIDSEIKDCQGSGLLVNEGAEVLISECKFSGMDKNGIEITKTEGNIEFEGVYIFNNKQNGILLNGVKADITDVKISNNKCSGIDATNCKLEVEGIELIENTFGCNVVGGKLSYESLECKKNKVGAILVENAEFKGKDSKFEDNQIGIFSKEESKAEVKTSSFTDNKFAVVCNNGSKAEANKVKFTGNERCVVVGNERDKTASKVNINESKFTKNGIHIESLKKAKIICKDSEFSNSNGVGIAVADGTVRIESSVIHDEEEAGVVTKGTIQLVGTRVENCGKCGVYFYGEESESENYVKDCEIVKNGPVGIQVMKGNPVLEGNTICGHTGYGIYIDSEASPNASNNSFSDNSFVNVNRD